LNEILYYLFSPHNLLSSGLYILFLLIVFLFNGPLDTSYLRICRRDLLHIFTARRYASAVLAVVVCLSVRLSVCPSVLPSVCLSHAGIVSKWLNAGSRKQCHKECSFLMPKISMKIERGHRRRGCQIQLGMSKLAAFDK